MTKSLRDDYPHNVINYPSLGADIDTSNNQFMVNQMGIDTIQQIANYETVVKMVERMGLTIEPMPKSNKLHKKITDEVKADTNRRFNIDKFTPIVERVKLPKVKGRNKALYISIVRNTPTLFDVATHHKKAKDSFCMLTYAGLHQPSKKVSSDAMKIISQFLKRKTFKLHSVDIAIDTTDHRSITYKRKESFRDNLMPYSKHGVICKGSSLYINNLDHLEEHPNMSRVIYYDKYLKQLNQQKKEIITNDLRAWKRLEVTLSFDVTRRENRGFIAYIESMGFVDDVYSIDEVAGLAGVKSYDDDYLIYQLNSLIDNRFMNNQESKEQFNSVQSLERFKSSDFRRYLLPI